MRRRLVWVSVLFVAIAAGFGPAASWILRNEIQRSMGLHAQAESLAFHRNKQVWHAPKLVLASTTNPSKPFIRCDQAWFQLSFSGLLSRKLDFPQVMLERAIIDAPVDRIPKPNLMERIVVDAIQLPADRGNELDADKWVDAIHELKVNQTQQEVRNRWNAHARTVDEQLTAVESSLSKMKQSAGAMDNPLRDLQNLQASIRESKRLREQLPAITKAVQDHALSRLHDQSSFRDANQKDIELISSRLLDPQSSAAQMRQALIHGIASLYLDRFRKMADVGATAVAAASIEQPQASRGQEYRFLSPRETPWQIEQALIRGKLDLDGQSLNVRGRIDHVAPATFSSKKPTTAQWKIERDNHTITVNARRERQTDQPNETIEVSTEKEPTQPWMLSFSDIVFNGNKGSVSSQVSWTKHGDGWNCHLHLVLDGINITASSESPGIAPIFWDRLNALLGPVNDFSIDGDIQVIPSQPIVCNLTSSVDDQLQLVFAMALTESMQEQRPAVATRYEAQYGNLFETMIAEATQRDRDTLNRISNLDQSIESFSSEVASRIDPRNTNRYTRTLNPNRTDR